MRSNFFKILLMTVLITVVSLASICQAGNKRMMSVNAAKVIAERALTESVYGLKLRASESVENMISASYVGSTETKTQAMIKGINIEETVYDAAKDIAKVTATISLPNITNINGETIDLKGKVFRRIGFGTSTPSAAGPLKALRAAEIDAYKQLVKQLVGFTLESQTKIENFMLTSDVAKTKVLATLFLAEVTEYGWHENGDAYVKMTLNLTDFADILGQGVAGGATAIKVEGMGAQVDDFAEAKKNPIKTTKKKK